MILYHGTSLDAWRSILEHGAITPRNGGLTSNWSDHPASSDHVYLTDTYATYFAQHAAYQHGSEEAVIIEVDVDSEYLSPDEDFLEAATRNVKQFDDAGSTLEERTAWFKKRMDDYAHYAALSLEKLGTVAHVGPILSHRIIRAVVYKPNPLIFVFDPTITLINHFFMNEYYKSSIKWLFDNEPIKEGFLLTDEGTADRDDMWEGLRKEVEPKVISVTDA